jgi:hypothetical protein
MIIYLPLLVSLIGLVLYFAVKTNAEVKEVGRLMFACGLLATLFAMSSGAWVHVLR